MALPNYRKMKIPSNLKIHNLLIVAALIFGISACSHTQKKNTSNTSADPVATQNAQSQSQQNVSPEPAANQNTSTTDNAPSGKKIKAPDFTLTRLNGKKFTLSDHLGKVIVLNIWATWCPPCRHEIPDFVQLQKEFKNKGVLFVGVSVDKKGPSVVKPFAKEHHMNYPVMVDNGTVSKEYGPIKYIPTTFVIGRDGYLKGYQPGMLTKNALKPVLEKLANQKESNS